MPTPPLKTLQLTLDRHAWGTHYDARRHERTGCACQNIEMGSEAWMVHLIREVMPSVFGGSDEATLRALRETLAHHRWGFPKEPDGYVRPGCTCGVTFFTAQQWMNHLREDVLPDFVVKHL